MGRKLDLMESTQGNERTITSFVKAMLRIAMACEDDDLVAAVLKADSGIDDESLSSANSQVRVQEDYGLLGEAVALVVLGGFLFSHLFFVTFFVTFVVMVVLVVVLMAVVVVFGVEPRGARFFTFLIFSKREEISERVLCSRSWVARLLLYYEKVTNRSSSWELC